MPRWRNRLTGIPANFTDRGPDRNLMSYFCAHPIRITNQPIQKMKRLFKLLSVTLSVAFFSIMSLTSCSDDNNAVQQVYYTFGFEQLSGGNELFSEMYKIEDAFKNEFN